MNHRKAKKDLTDKMRRVAELIKKALPASMGFAVFLELDGAIQYAAKAERSNVIEMLDEWFLKTETMWVGPPAPIQKDEERIRQQERCADIGKVISLLAKVALFVFDYGDGGNLSYWSNMETKELHRTINEWLEKQKP